MDRIEADRDGINLQDTLCREETRGLDGGLNGGLG